MRAFLLLLPAGLSALVLGAHFLRRGDLALVAVSLTLFGLLFVRRQWAARDPDAGARPNRASRRLRLYASGPGGDLDDGACAGVATGLYGPARPCSQGCARLALSHWMVGCTMPKRSARS